MPVTEVDDGITILVKVQPRSSCNKISEILTKENKKYLKLKLTSPPVNNEANLSCQEFLSEIFTTPKTDVILLWGQKSKEKLWKIKGDPKLLLKKWEEILNSI